MTDKHRSGPVDATHGAPGSPVSGAPADVSSAGAPAAAKSTFEQAAAAAAVAGAATTAGATATAGATSATSAAGVTAGGDPGLAEAFAHELAAARRLADEHWDKYLRAEAELDNFRKRSERLREEALGRTRRGILGGVLDVADNLRRALAAESADSTSLRTGVEGTLRQLERLLALEGVTPIEAMGMPFDPALHEAVAAQERPDLDSERVIEVERPGYLLNGELLRPARVVVGRPPDNHA